jgi:hypothetical protein
MGSDKVTRQATRHEEARKPPRFCARYSRFHTSQQIAFGKHPYNMIVIVSDRKAADVVVHHQPDRLGEWCVLMDRNYRSGHEVCCNHRNSPCSIAARMPQECRPAL